MNSSELLFRGGQLARDIKAIAEYPIWLINGKPSPDNHLYKKQRIRNISEKYKCNTFIETGTFYGQMVRYAADYFEKVVSIEIHEPFYLENNNFFKEKDNVNILLGDSSIRLADAITMSEGKILFWLDGHYSGTGTGVGNKISPIIEELRIIANFNPNNHCIIIDDRRLFSEEGGYPTIDEVIIELKDINADYKISYDFDSILALI
ncbi:hypothetical protein OAS51_01300 [Candidatus Thioglobus sp.]|nr:hypothetical protein [Candidatus Thioglobus sp.]